jgi:hypothetical protein
MIARFKLWLALRRRRKVRLVESERVRKGQIEARRKAWANDPLRGAI